MTKVTSQGDYFIDFIMFSCFYMSFNDAGEPEQLRMVPSEAHGAELECEFFCTKKNTYVDTSTLVSLKG